MKKEIPTKLKKLGELVKALELKLEERGFRITASEHGVNIGQFLDHNIPNIISACQGLLRGESSERHYLRLQKEFAIVFRNLDKIKSLPQAKALSSEIEEIESILKHLHTIYKEI